MTALKDDVADKEEDSNRHLYYIPIACAIFTFVYWFIFTPLLWSTVSPGEESFSVFLLVLGAFWALIVGLMLLIWGFKYRDHKNVQKTEKDRVSIVKKDSISSSHSNSPPFPTKAQMIQPSDSPISYQPRCTLIGLNVGLEKDNLSTISLNSLPIQPNNTPSLYNAKTGRQSYESGYPEGVVLPKKPSSIDALEKKISSSSSSSSSSASLTDRNVDVEDGLKEDMKKKKDEPDEDIPIEITVAQTHEMPRMSSKDSFHGLPEMNAFDGYLHLTTVDTPLSPPTAEVPDSSGLTPREIFFSDLIHNAEDGERKPGDRRSFCVGDYTMPKEVSAADKRKSMPLYLYFTSTPPPYEEAKPLQSVTDSEAYSLSSLSQKITNEELECNLERFDSERRSTVEFEQLESELVDQPDVDAAEGDRRHSSGGEFFIANVLGKKSMTSEVRLEIGGNPEPEVRRSTSEIHWRIVGDIPEREGYASDDNVFEDDVKTK